MLLINKTINYKNGQLIKPEIINNIQHSKRFFHEYTRLYYIASLQLINTAQNGTFRVIKAKIIHHSNLNESFGFNQVNNLFSKF